VRRRLDRPGLRAGIHPGGAGHKLRERGAFCASEISYLSALKLRTLEKTHGLCERSSIKEFSLEHQAEAEGGGPVNLRWRSPQRRGAQNKRILEKPSAVVPHLIKNTYYSTTKPNHAPPRLAVASATSDWRGSARCRRARTRRSRRKGSEQWTDGLRPSKHREASVIARVRPQSIF